MSGLTIRGVTVGRECDSIEGGLIVIRKACQPIQRCGSVHVVGEIRNL